MIQLNTVKYKDSLLIIIRLYHIDRQILLLILTQCDLPKNPSLAVLMRNLNEITVHLIFFFFFNLSSLIALFQTLWFEFIDFQDAHTGKMHVCGMYLLSHSSSLFFHFHSLHVHTLCCNISWGLVHKSSDSKIYIKQIVLSERYLSEEVTVQFWLKY